MNNTRQTELLLDKSDHYMSRVAAWAIVTLIGLVAFIFILQDPAVRYMAAGGTLLMFSGGSFITLLYMMKYARVNGMMHDSSAPPAVRFEQETEAPAARIVSRTADNQLSLSRFQYSPSDWRLLIKELRITRHKWTRKALANTKLFPYVTAPGEFNKITKEFERLGVVDGRARNWYVTDAGWTMLHEVANLPVIT